MELSSDLITAEKGKSDIMGENEVKLNNGSINVEDMLTLTAEVSSIPLAEEDVHCVTLNSEEKYNHANVHCTSDQGDLQEQVLSQNIDSSIHDRMNSFENCEEHLPGVLKLIFN